MRELESEDIRGNALENRHFAVSIAHIVAGLAPPVGGVPGTRAREQQREHGDEGDDMHIALTVVRGLAVLRLLDLDGLGHLRVVGIGRQRAIGLLHDGDLARIRRGQRAFLLTRRRGVCELRLLLLVLVVLVRIGRLHQRRGTLGGGTIVAQGGCRRHRLVDDVRDGFEVRVRRAAHQRGLVRQIERVHIKGQGGVRDHGGDVIGAAGTQGHAHQTLRAFGEIRHGHHGVRDGRVLQHAAQAVRAQQPTVRRMRLEHRDIGMRVDVEIAEHAHHHVALRVVLGLLLGDATGIDQMLDVTMVLGHLAERAVAQQIRAGIADMRQHPVIVHQGDGGDRRAHARKLAFMPSLADDGVVRGHDGGLHHRGDRGHVLLTVVAFDMRQRADGDGGCGVAARVAAHAVADGHEMFAGERGILIVRAHRAHVGHGGGVQEQLAR